MTELEKMAKGYLWEDTEAYLEEQRIAKELMYDFNQSRPSEGEKRKKIAKQLFGYVGEDVFIQQPITIARGKTVTIGDGTYINSNLMLVDDYHITIGKNCLIAPNVSITTTGHPVDPELRAKKMYSFPVTIENNVWIGMGAIILPGVTIGENSIIGAGSVVTKDIPANVIAFGSPCKVWRAIDERDKEYYYRNLRLDEQL
ncbi:DapH/DapD/GlmU-related protein [Anaerotignum sp.]